MRAKAERFGYTADAAIFFLSTRYTDAGCLQKIRKKNEVNIAVEAHALYND